MGKIMTMDCKQWEEILGAVNKETDLSKDNVIDKIKADSLLLAECDRIEKLMEKAEEKQLKQQALNKSISAGNKSISAGGATALLGTAAAVALFATGTVAVEL